MSLGDIKINQNDFEKIKQNNEWSFRRLPLSNSVLYNFYTEKYIYIYTKRNFFFTSTYHLDDKRINYLKKGVSK